MHQLGLHELAEAVLGRARRRAGNKATALVGLMLQYQRQGKLDVAVQVAMQILRSTTATRQTNPNVYNADDPDASPHRRHRRPGPVRPAAPAHRQGQRAAQEDPQRHPDPPGPGRLLQGRRPARQGPRRAGQDRRAPARRRQPALPGRPAARAGRPGRRGHRALQGHPQERPRRSSPATSTRSRTPSSRPARPRSCSSLLEQIDLRQLGQPYYRLQPDPEPVLNDDKLRDRAMPLFTKAWDAFPDERSHLLQLRPHERALADPEMYDYARESIVPKPDDVRPPPTQWNAFAQILSYGGDGRMTSVVSRMLDLAAVAGEARRALRAGRGRAQGDAGLDGRRRGPRPGRLPARPLRPGPGGRSAASSTRPRTSRSRPTSTGSIGAELEDHAPTRDLAVSCLRGQPQSRRRRPLLPARLRQRARQAAGRALRARAIASTTPAASCSTSPRTTTFDVCYTRRVHRSRCGCRRCGSAADQAARAGLRRRRRLALQPGARARPRDPGRAARTTSAIARDWSASTARA